MDKYSFCKKTVKEITAKIADNSSSRRTINTVRKTHNDKQILVIITAEIDKQIIGELTKFRRYGIKVNLLLAKEILSKVNKDLLCKKIGVTNLLYEGGNVDIEKVLSEIDAVILSVSDLSYIAKLSQGIQDDLISKVVYKTLTYNKLLYVDFDRIDSDSKTAGNFELNKIQETQLSAAKKMGVKEIHSSEYLIEALRTFKISANAVVKNTREKERHMKKSKREVITESDINKIEENTKALVISKSAIITSLARDVALRRGIEIIKK